jgi:nucleoside-diphosphate-sugar epimerase
MRVLVTGASGFVGRRVCALLAASDCEVVAATRVTDAPLPGAARTLALGGIGPATHWQPALDGCDALVHLAARTHQGDDATMRDDFFRINVEGTRGLIDAALAAGVRRVVFVSSAKVYGESSPLDADGRPHAFTATDVPRPAGPYGASKLAAEALLRERCATARAALTILRPPLVYGPGNKANLFALMRAIERGVPLPLASIRNARSLVFVDHLAEAIGAALAQADGTHVYPVADVELSTPALSEALAAGMRKPARLLPCPVRLLALLGRLTGRGAAIERLTGSLVLEHAQITRELGWRPRFTLAEAMRLTGDGYWSARG